MRQAEADSGRRRDLPRSEEREELERLRKENAGWMIVGWQLASNASTSSAPHPRSAPGGASDNAIAEAWVATFKSELVDGRRFPSVEHAEHEVLHWIRF